MDPAPTQQLLEIEHNIKCQVDATVPGRERAYRFIAHCPPSLRLALLKLLRAWGTGGNYDSAGALIRDLRTRLRSALHGELDDESRRDDLASLQEALAGQKRAAGELAAAVRRGG